MNISRALELIELLHRNNNLSTVKIKIETFDNDYRCFSGIKEYCSEKSDNPYYSGSLQDLKDDLNHYTNWSGESYSFNLMVWPKTGEKGTYGVLPVIDLPLDKRDCACILDLCLTLSERNQNDSY